MIVQYWGVVIVAWALIVVMIMLKKYWAFSCFMGVLIGLTAYDVLYVAPGPSFLIGLGSFLGVGFVIEYITKK